MVVCHGGPGNTPLFGSVANGSTIGPGSMVETRWDQGALEFASQVNDGIYPIHSMEQTRSPLLSVTHPSSMRST